MLWEMVFAVYVINQVRYNQYSVLYQSNSGSFSQNFQLCLCTVQEALFAVA